MSSICGFCMQLECTKGESAEVAWMNCLACAVCIAAMCERFPISPQTLWKFLQSISPQVKVKIQADVSNLNFALHCQEPRKRPILVELNPSSGCSSVFSPYSTTPQSPWGPNPHPFQLFE